MSSLIRVAQVVGAFGIRGQVKILPLTDFAERFDPGRRLMAGDTWLTVKDVLEHGGQVILSFREVTSRTEAERLQWEYLLAQEDERPELDEDEFLTADLVGIRVVDESNHELGTISEVLMTPAHDVFVVSQEGRKDILVPAVKEFVLTIDMTSKTAVVRLIDGMIEE